MTGRRDSQSDVPLREVAAKGVLIAAINCRPGRFGFFAHPELSAEPSYQSSGNYAIMDQIAALKRLQRKIKAFGGDPGNVTIAGCSAGDSSVHILSYSPTARSLFHKAICEGGPGLVPVAHGLSHIASFSTPRAAEQVGTELLDILGAENIAELRRMPAERIIAAQLPRARGVWASMSNQWPDPVSLGAIDMSNAIVDGHILPRLPMIMFLSCEVASVPTLAGNTGNEVVIHLGSRYEYQDFLEHKLGKDAADMFRLYPATSDSEVRTTTWQLLGDEVFV